MVEKNIDEKIKELKEKFEVKKNKVLKRDKSTIMELDFK